MIVKKLKFENFRNLLNNEIVPCEKVNVIYGDNAQGKTNLLESIYYLSVTKSHHSFLDNKLVTNGENGLSVEGIINKEDINTKYTINKNQHLNLDPVQL